MILMIVDVLFTIVNDFAVREATLRCREERYPCTPLCDGIRQFR